MARMIPARPARRPLRYKHHRCFRLPAQATERWLWRGAGARQCEALLPSAAVEGGAMTQLRRHEAAEVAVLRPLRRKREVAAATACGNDGISLRRACGVRRLRHLVAARDGSLRLLRRPTAAADDFGVCGTSQGARHPFTAARCSAPCASSRARAYGRGREAATAAALAVRDGCSVAPRSAAARRRELATAARGGCSSTKDLAKCISQQREAA